MNRLRTGIYEKSGSIDLKNISEGSNQRVISIKAQLMPLENNCATTESYFRAGFSILVDLFIDWMSKYFSKEVHHSDFVFDFERVFPTDMSSMASVTKTYVESGVSLDESLKIAGHDNYEEIADNSKTVEVIPSTNTDADIPLDIDTED